MQANVTISAISALYHKIENVKSAEKWQDFLNAGSLYVENLFNSL